MHNASPPFSGFGEQEKPPEETISGLLLINLREIKKASDLEAHLEHQKKIGHIAR